MSELERTMADLMDAHEVRRVNLAYLRRPPTPPEVIQYTVTVSRDDCAESGVLNVENSAMCDPRDIERDIALLAKNALFAVNQRLSHNETPDQG